MGKLKVHPLATVYPSTSGPQYSDIRDSIEKNGQLEPIVLLDDQILDGRTRNEICDDLGLEPRTRQYRGPRDIQSLISFVQALNEHRRHLTIGQRAVAAWKLDKFLYETSENGSCANLRSRKQAVAERADASPRIVDFAKKVVDEGAKSVVAAVEADEVTVSDAAAVADLPKGEQVAALSAVRRGRARTLKQAATDFDPAKLNGKRKQGKQKTNPTLRRKAEALFATLIRMLDRMGITPDIEPELRKVLEAIKG